MSSLLPADAQYRISLSPTQFDEEYPGESPFVIDELKRLTYGQYVTLNTARAFNRICMMFQAVEMAVFRCDILDRQREVVWGIIVELLDHGGVWLWADSDEEKSRPLPQWPNASRDYLTRKLSSSRLRLRMPSDSPKWDELQARVVKSSSEMRFAVILWAILTSVPVREARWTRGLSDPARCLGAALHLWLAFMDHWTDNPGLKMCSAEQEASALSLWQDRFQDNLRRHGHSCFVLDNLLTFGKDPIVIHWLWLQSFLHPVGIVKETSMTLFQWCNTCQQCCKIETLYSANNDLHYVPSTPLILVTELSEGMLDIMDVLPLLVSRGMLSPLVRLKVDYQIRMQFAAHFSNGFDCDFQPWVHRLPERLHSLAVLYTESEWRAAEDVLRWNDTQPYVPPTFSTDIGVGVWVAAVYLLLAEFSSKTVTPRKFYTDCYEDHISLYYKCFPLLYPSYLSISIEAFNATLFDVSAHSCCEYTWSGYPREMYESYAAAYLLLHPESSRVLSLDPSRRPGMTARQCCLSCQACEACLRLPPEEEDFAVSAEQSNVTWLPNQVMPANDDSINLTSEGSSTETFWDVLPTEQMNETEMPSLRQIPPASHGTSSLSKDLIIPKLKDHFIALLAEHKVPIQYTNLGAPQLPWCTLPQILRTRGLEIAGWPGGIPLPDATGKYNAKGIMGLTAKELV